MCVCQILSQFLDLVGKPFSGETESVSDAALLLIGVLMFSHISRQCWISEMLEPDWIWFRVLQDDTACRRCRFWKVVANIFSICPFSITLSFGEGRRGPAVISTCLWVRVSWQLAAVVQHREKNYLSMSTTRQGSLPGNLQWNIATYSGVLIHTV